MYSGQCLCGGVQFVVDAQLPGVQICHCQQCRRAQGAPFASNIPVSTTVFRLTGEALLSRYESSPGKQRVFCSRCGSPIYSQLETLPGVVRLRAGLISEPLRNGPVAHFYTDSKCNWWPISDGLPCFAQGGVAARP